VTGIPTLVGETVRLDIELGGDALEDKIDHDWTNAEPYGEDGGSAFDWQARNRLGGGVAAALPAGVISYFL
jgi:hypothetical protein